MNDDNPDRPTSRRIERPKRSGPDSPWTTVPRWTTPTLDDVAAMPVGTRRAVMLAPGLHTTVVKTAPDAWTLTRRYGLPDDLLTRVPSAPRVRRENTSPGASAHSLTSFAEAVDRMTDAQR